MQRTVDSTSVEYVEIGVESHDDPTGGTVEIGLSTSDDDVAPTTWHAGTWNGKRTVNRGPGEGFAKAWVGRFLFGSGTLILPIGEYYAWARVSFGAQTIVRKTDDIIAVV